MSTLELIINRMREIEDSAARVRDCDFRIYGSCDFVRQLLREAEAEGFRVEQQPDSPNYFLGGFPLGPVGYLPDCFLGGFPIKAVTYLPKNTFLIELDPPVD